MDMPKAGETLTLDPKNPEHVAFMNNYMRALRAPVTRDSLKIADTKPQKVLTVSDLENIARAEAKRERKAARR